MDCSPPSSSVHGIFQARILEWAAISFSRTSSQSRDRTCASWIGKWICHWANWEAHKVKSSSTSKIWVSNQVLKLCFAVCRECNIHSSHLFSKVHLCVSMGSFYFKWGNWGFREVLSHCLCYSVSSGLGFVSSLRIEQACQWHLGLLSTQTRRYSILIGYMSEWMNE